jgi:hypothetical protein
MFLKIKAFCCKNKLKEIEKFYIKLYKRSVEIIANNMDMINYLKFMQEYIYLKCLLFDDFQSLCMSFVRKPKIYEKNRFLKINSNSYKKLKEIIISLRKKTDYGDLDEKIYDLISDEIKSLISNSVI